MTKKIGDKKFLFSQKSHDVRKNSFQKSFEDTSDENLLLRNDTQQNFYWGCDVTFCLDPLPPCHTLSGFCMAPYEIIVRLQGLQGLCD